MINFQNQWRLSGFIDFIRISLITSPNISAFGADKKALHIALLGFRMTIEWRQNTTLIRNK